MFIRESVIKEEVENRKRIDPAKFEDYLVSELHSLEEEDPILGGILGNSVAHLARILEDDGAPERVVKYLAKRYLNTDLALVSMFRKELELRALENIWGKVVDK